MAPYTQSFNWLLIWIIDWFNFKNTIPGSFKMFPQNPHIFSKLTVDVLNLHYELFWPPNINNDLKDYHFRNTAITKTCLKTTLIHFFISLNFRHAWAFAKSNTLQTATFHFSMAGSKISGPMVLAETEEEEEEGGERWGSKTQISRGVRRCRGEWRGRTEIRLVREAERARAARSDASWSLLITTDSFIISTYWTHCEFTTTSCCVWVAVCMCTWESVSLCSIEYITFWHSLVEILQLTVSIQLFWVCMPPKSTLWRRQLILIWKLLNEGSFFCNQITLIRFKSFCPNP